MEGFGVELGQQEIGRHVVPIPGDTLFQRHDCILGSVQFSEKRAVCILRGKFNFKIHAIHYMTIGMYIKIPYVPTH